MNHEAKHPPKKIIAGEKDFGVVYQQRADTDRKRAD